MRLNWIVAQGNIPTMSDIHAACSSFYSQHRTVPDTVKMSYNDMTNFLNMSSVSGLIALERGKEYGNFVCIPGGMVELLVLELEAETTVSYSGGAMIVVESTQIDREFEKHVLNSETK